MYLSNTQMELSYGLEILKVHPKGTRIAAEPDGIEIDILTPIELLARARTGLRSVVNLDSKEGGLSLLRRRE